MLTLTTPDGGTVLLREDIVAAVLTPFAWGPGRQARNVHLTTGGEIIVSDTVENMTALTTALLGQDSSFVPASPALVAGISVQASS